MNIQESFIPDPGFGFAYTQAPQDDGALQRLKEIAQQYCPDELRAERQAVLPDEELHLEELEAGFKALLAGGNPFSDLPYIGDAVQYGAVSQHPSEQPSDITPADNGFGIGIPETQKLQNLHYEEVDTLNSDQIKKDFPVLNQKVNGHDLVWLDNGATTQKP
ncbi:MAG: hypothetical protein IJ067_10200, partial [Prevotella sp.]|nr:hypothetical protein [Prevotella sp.]